jgi:hypothetical protein
MPQGPLSNDPATNPSGDRVPLSVDANGNLIVTSASGGDAVSIADGADVTQGAKADVAWTTGSGSVVALLKAIVGKFATTLTVSILGATPANYAANNTGVAVKGTAGVLRGLSVNTAGVTSTVTLYDGASTGGTKLGTWASTTAGSWQFNITFSTGLFAVLAGGTAADVTITYN